MHVYVAIACTTRSICTHDIFLNVCYCA